MIDEPKLYCGLQSTVLCSNGVENCDTPDIEPDTKDADAILCGRFATGSQ